MKMSLRQFERVAGAAIRAGLAAVALSDRSDRLTAETLWDKFDALPDPALSKLYFVLGASSLARDTRGSLYAHWTGESFVLTATIAAVASGADYDMTRL